MLKRIHVEYYKSLKNVDVPCAGLNLLTGVNGAGKSSFVQVLRLLHLAADKIEELRLNINVEDFGGGTRESDLFYRYGEKPEDIVISVSYTDDSGREFTISRCVERRRKIKKDDTIFFDHPDYSSIVKAAYSEVYMLKEDMVLKEIKEEEMAEGGLIFVNLKNVSGDKVKVAEEKADRWFEEQKQKIRDSEHDKTVAFKHVWKGGRFIDAFRQRPTDVSSGGDLFCWDYIFSRSFDDIKHFNPEGNDVMGFLYECNQIADKTLIEKVNQCLNWVSPGASLDIKEEKAGDDRFFVSAIDYGVDGDKRLFKPQNVGFGVSYILPVLAVLLTAEKGNILIIENPEAHLHPRGQAEIGKLIAETVARGVQVFVETHSDHLINGVRVAVKKGILKPDDVNIAFFERKEHDTVDMDGKESREIFTAVKDIKIDANGAISEYPDGFMDEWSNQMMRLFDRT